MGLLRDYYDVLVAYQETANEAFSEYAPIPEYIQYPRDVVSYADEHPNNLFFIERVTKPYVAYYEHLFSDGLDDDFAVPSEWLLDVLHWLELLVREKETQERVADYIFIDR